VALVVAIVILGFIADWTGYLPHPAADQQ
jgi:hypothetical protein